MEINMSILPYFATGDLNRESAILLVPSGERREVFGRVLAAIDDVVMAAMEHTSYEAALVRCLRPVLHKRPETLKRLVLLDVGESRLRAPQTGLYLWS